MKNAMFVLVGLFLASSVFATPIITNGGFEQEYSSGNWVDWREYAVSGAAVTYISNTTDVFEGSTAAEILVTNASGDNGLDRAGSRIVVTPGETVSLTFAAKEVAPDTAWLRVHLVEYTAGGDFLGATFKFFDLGSSYATYEFEQTLGGTTGLLQPGFRLYEGNGSGIKATGHYLLDDVQIIPEPATFGLFALMGGGILWTRKIFTI